MQNTDIRSSIFFQIILPFDLVISENEPKEALFPLIRRWFLNSTLARGLGDCSKSWNSLWLLNPHRKCPCCCCFCCNFHSLASCFSWYKCSFNSSIFLSRQMISSSTIVISASSTCTCTDQFKFFSVRVVWLKFKITLVNFKEPSCNVVCHIDQNWNAEDKILKDVAYIENNHLNSNSNRWRMEF